MPRPSHSLHGGTLLGMTLFPFQAASLADPVPIRPNIQIVADKFVASDAMRLAAISVNTATSILSGRYWLQMIRVRTSPIATEMIELKPVRDRFYQVLVEQSMNIRLLTADSSHPVSSNLCHRLDVTSIGLEHQLIHNINYRVPPRSHQARPPCLPLQGEEHDRQ